MILIRSATAYADSLIILSEMTAKVCQTGAVIFVSWNYAYHAQFLSFIRLETEKRMKLNRQVHILHLLKKWLKIKFLIFAANSPVSG